MVGLNIQTIDEKLDTEEVFTSCFPEGMIPLFEGNHYTTRGMVAKRPCRNPSSESPRDYRLVKTQPYDHRQRHYHI
jgi:hypothetical protein